MKTKIGLIAAASAERASKVLRGYIRAAELTGVMPIIIPYLADEELLDEMLGMCAGIAFLGGEDVEPALYGEEKKPTCGTVVDERDEFELHVFKKVINSGKPIMGICLGMQLLFERSFEYGEHKGIAYDTVDRTANIGVCNKRIGTVSRYPQG